MVDAGGVWWWSETLVAVVKPRSRGGGRVDGTGGDSGEAMEGVSSGGDADALLDALDRKRQQLESAKRDNKRNKQITYLK